MRTLRLCFTAMSFFMSNLVLASDDGIEVDLNEDAAVSVDEYMFNEDIRARVQGDRTQPSVLIEIRTGRYDWKSIYTVDSEKLSGFTDAFWRETESDCCKTKEFLFKSNGEFTAVVISVETKDGKYRFYRNEQNFKLRLDEWDSTSKTWHSKRDFIGGGNGIRKFTLFYNSQSELLARISDTTDYGWDLEETPILVSVEDLKTERTEEFLELLRLCEG